jgi:hypothetical protein
MDLSQRGKGNMEKVKLADRLRGRRA